ncbi:FG-GAP repeat domain-containing protein [Lysobacter sp. 2RAF19]
MFSWKWVWLWVSLASLVWVSVRRDEPQAPKIASAQVTVATTQRSAIKRPAPRPLAPIASAAAVAPPATPGYSFDVAGAIPAPWFGPDQQNWASSFGAVDIGDVTGDGRADVVALGNGVASGELYPDTDSELLVYRQQPSGLLAQPARYKMGLVSAYHLQIGDFNEDGRGDVLVIGDKSMQVYVSKAAGGFDSYTRQIWDPVELATLTPAALMDVNWDGHLDVVFHLSRTHAGGSAPIGPNVNTFSRLVVWYGDGHGQFPTRWSTVTFGTTEAHDVEKAISLATGDLNNDGRRDLIVRVEQFNGAQRQVLRTWFTNGSGRLVPGFEMNPIMETGSNTSSMDFLALGDFNGDGRTDIAAADGAGAAMNTRTWVVHQSAAGKFDTTPVSRLGEPIGNVIRTADLDRNGADDLILAHDGWARSSWLLQSGGALLASQMKENGGTDGRVSQTGLAVGDINGDGCPDAVMSYSYYGLQVMQGHNCGKAVRMPRAVASAPAKASAMRRIQR